MKKFILLAGVICTVVTFAGAAYVLSTGGEANAGYAAIPMIFTFAFMYGSRGKK